MIVDADVLAATVSYAPYWSKSTERAAAHSTGLRFFLFEADGTLRRLPKRTVDGMVRGEHRVKTVLSTDTFVRQNGVWKEVAGHSSVVK